MKKILGLLATLASVVALTACGGSDPAPKQVATENLSAPVTAENVAALSSAKFTFAGGVPDFETTGTTSLTFTGTSTTPAFTIASGGNTASGITTFGSCIFTVTTSTFPAGHALAKDSVIEVEPCSFNVETVGAVSGESEETEATLTLGTATSSPITVTIVIQEDGTVVVNNQPVGKVDTKPTTGSSSTS